jgi:glycosyltransferase involved in cell wall biosynthesis
MFSFPTFPFVLILIITFLEREGGIFAFMETPKPHGEVSISELKARLYEKERIEQFLRAEVKELWSYIKIFEKDPFLKVYLRTKSGMVKIFLRFSNFTKKSFKGPNLDKSTKLKNINHSCEILLVLPSDKIEIGGLVSANKFINELFVEGYSVKKVALSHDPSANVTNDIDVVKSIAEVVNSKLVLACGAETVKFVQDYAHKHQNKSVLLMQGPDPFFTPKFNDSVDFLDTLSQFNLVLTYSPYLEKLARFWGAVNVTTAVFGPDENVFGLNELIPRKNIIVVPCRFATEKGIKILLPSLSRLRQSGWKVIGFGDLPDLAMSNYFDDFIGRITPTETSQLFQSSKIIIDPSLIEGLGLTTLEAAKCGCIPIIQKRGGFEDMFESNKLPFIEIDNFLIPQVLLDAVKQSQVELNPRLVNERVSEINWSNGLRIAKNEIKKLLRS